MRFAEVIGKVISTEKHPHFEARKLLFVQPLGLDQQPQGRPTIAIDYVSAGEGDIVLLGAAPGLSKAVFGIENSPMRELIMGVVDRANLSEFPAFGVSVPEPPRKTDLKKPKSAKKSSKKAKS